MYNRNEDLCDVLERANEVIYQYQQAVQNFFDSDQCYEQSADALDFQRPNEEEVYFLLTDIQSLLTDFRRSQDD